MTNKNHGCDDRPFWTTPNVLPRRPTEPNSCRVPPPHTVPLLCCHPSVYTNTQSIPMCCRYGRPSQLLSRPSPHAVPLLCCHPSVYTNTQSIHNFSVRFSNLGASKKRKSSTKTYKSYELARARAQGDVHTRARVTRNTSSHVHIPGHTSLQPRTHSHTQLNAHTNTHTHAHTHVGMGATIRTHTY